MVGLEPRKVIVRRPGCPYYPWWKTFRFGFLRVDRERYEILLVHKPFYHTEWMSQLSG